MSLEGESQIKNILATWLSAIVVMLSLGEARAEFFWHEDGRLDYLIRPNGTERRMHFDSLVRLSGITERDAAGELLLTYQLGYKPSDEVDHRFYWPRNPSNQTFHAISSGAHDGDNSITSLNGESFVYDADGNLTEGFFNDPAVMETASWDARNRLTGIGTTSYRYDMEGHRVEVTHEGETTQALIDPHSGPVLSLCIYAEGFTIA